MPRVLELLRKPAVQLAVGLGVSAVAGSVYLIILNLAFTGQKSSGHSILVLNSGLNTVLATIATGVMAGLEQEMIRAVSRALTRGSSPVKVVRRQVKQAIWLIVGTVVFCLALSPVMVPHMLGGDWVLFAELILGLVGAMATFQVRGTLSGRQDYLMYSATLVVQGLTMVVPGLILLALGCHTVGWYGFLFAISWVAAAVSGVVLPPLFGRPSLSHGISGGDEEVPDDESERRTAANLALLTGATMASQLLMNAIILLLAVSYSRSGDADLTKTAAAITSAVGLTRLGIFALLPLQAPLLPALTAAATRGDMREVRQRTRHLAVICSALGGGAVLVSGTLGPLILNYVMRALHSLPAWFLAVFAAGALFMMLSFILQSALIALSRHLTVMIGWSLGVAVTIPVFAFADSTDILGVTAVGAVLGPFVTTVFLAVDFWRSTRSAHQGGDEDGDGENGGTTLPTPDTESASV